MEAHINSGGVDGDDGSGLETEIDGMIGLLAGDADQAVVQFAMAGLRASGPAAFWRLAAAIRTTEDASLRLRAIEVLGLSCRSHIEPVAILAGIWEDLVDPVARESIRRFLFTALDERALNLGFSRPEPQPEPRVRKKPRRAASSRGLKLVTKAILPPPGEVVDT
jgi:hypothetical protein